VSVPAPLTDDEKSRVRYHMGYPEVRAAATFALGMPATVETAFLIELALNQLTDQGRARCRYILSVLDSLDAQMVDNAENLAAEAVGDIKINLREQKHLNYKYDRWVASLSNLLTVPRNPFDQRLTQSGGINVGVMG